MPTANAYGLKLSMCEASVPIWAKKSAGILSSFNPSRSRSCDSPISTAMPLVKPMMMLTGM